MEGFVAANGELTDSHSKCMREPTVAASGASVWFVHLDFFRNKSAHHEDLRGRGFTSSVNISSSFKGNKNTTVLIFG